MRLPSCQGAILQPRYLVLPEHAALWSPPGDFRLSMICRLAVSALCLVVSVERAAALTSAERDCQKAIAVAGRAIFGRSLAILASCRNAGEEADCFAATREERDAAASSPSEKLRGECTDAEIASLSPAGDCSSAKTVDTFLSCLRASHESQAAIVSALAGTSAQSLRAGRRCQAEASRQARRFAVKRLRLLQRCKQSPQLFRLPPGAHCTADARIAAAIDDLRARASSAVGAACGSGESSTTALGAPCDGASSQALAECLLSTATDASDVAIEAEFPSAGFCGDGRDAVEKRIDELLAAMTLEEKVEQMHGYRFDGTWQTKGVERLGVPGLGMLDGPRGVSFYAGKATSFPVAIARGATWDVDLEARVGEAIGDEARAKGASVLLAPVLNILRHPRWGRAQEGYGEDTFHLGRMGVGFVEGVQRHAIASVKHFAVNSIEDTRTALDVTVDERSLREIYLRHFQMAVEDGHAGSIMSAYNQVNGRFCSESSHLLGDVLKGDWGFRGFVESDWFVGVHSTVDAAEAGLDIEMPFSVYFGTPLADAVATETLDREVIDEAVRRIVRAQLCFRLDSEPPVVDPSRLETQAHLDLALAAAQRSIVLLRNEDDALPLDRGQVSSIAVVGPLADLANLGDVRGSSNVTPSSAVSPLDGISAAAGPAEVTYFPGPALTGEDLAAIGAAGAAVVIAGLTDADEGEGFVSAGDREGLNLSAEQESLIAAVGAANPRTIVVLEGGSAITMPWIADVAAVLMAWYPGQRGGDAIADVLFGEVNPSGKLPVTFAAAEADLPPFDNQSLAVTYGYFHGYRWLDREATTSLFPFGFGLSYTTFRYSNLTVSPAAASAGARLRITADVTNTGQVAGEEVVQLYVSYVGSRVERAVKDLKAFARVRLEPGETRTVPLELRTTDLAFYDVDAGAWEVEPIEYVVRVGGSSGDLPLEGSFTIDRP